MFRFLLAAVPVVLSFNTTLVALSDGPPTDVNRAQIAVTRTDDVAHIFPQRGTSFRLVEAIAQVLEQDGATSIEMMVLDSKAIKYSRQHAPILLVSVQDGSHAFVGSMPNFPFSTTRGIVEALRKLKVEDIQLVSMEDLMTPKFDWAPPLNVLVVSTAGSNLSRTQAAVAEESAVKEEFAVAEDATIYTRTYATHDLPVWTHDSEFSPKMLMTMIESSVAPGSWKSRGGPSKINAYSQNRSLVVSTTHRNHDFIAALLNDHRTGANENKVEAATREFETRIAEYRAGRAPINIVLESNRRLLSAALNEKIPGAYMAYDKRAAALESLAKNNLDLGSGTVTEFAQATESRLDATLRTSMDSFKSP